jgi:hypothetical protein
MRLIVALSAMAMIGLTSSAMESGSSSSRDSSINLTQSPTGVGSECTVAGGGRAGGFFRRMMELERRKNAWFRGVFS